MKQNMRNIYLFFSMFILSVNILNYGIVERREDSKQGVQSDIRFISADSIQIKCYDSPKYFVIGREILGNPGTDFLIKYKSTPDQKFPCSYTPEKNDFEIKADWVDYYAGMKGDLLILDSTTGPGPSGLTIWDLKKRKKVFDGLWSDPEESDVNTLIYWMETDQATEKNCPKLKEWESHGLGAAIETKVILDLSNFKITKTKETRCSPRQ